MLFKVGYHLHIPGYRIIIHAYTVFVMCLVYLCIGARRVHLSPSSLLTGWHRANVGGYQEQIWRTVAHQLGQEGSERGTRPMLDGDCELVV